MLARIFWRLLEDIPVVLVVIGVLYMVGMSFDRDIATAAYYLLAGFAFATILGFIEKVLLGR